MKLKVVTKGQNCLTSRHTSGERESIEYKDVEKVEIVLGGTKYRLNFEHGELVINKTNFDEHAISIRPCVTNQIAIK